MITDPQSWNLHVLCLPLRETKTVLGLAFPIKFIRRAYNFISEYRSKIFKQIYFYLRRLSQEEEKGANENVCKTLSLEE